MRRLPWPVRLLIVLAALYLYFAVLHPHERVPDHPIFDRPGPWVMAHRGGRGLWPESTLYALEQAEALGVDVLEMDLRATSDGRIVVIHDSTVDRTTDGSGRVGELTLDQIRQLDAGYRFQDDSGQFAFRGQGLVVPTLEEVLSRFDESLLNFELKEFTPELAQRFCDLLRQYDATSRALVASFEDGSLAAFRGSCPSVATSATYREALTLYLLSKVYLSSLYRGPAVALQAPDTFFGRSVIDPGTIALAEAFNIKVQVWTVNDEADMKRLLDLGVQGILTDHPDRMLRLLGRLPASTGQSAALPLLDQ